MRRIAAALLHHPVLDRGGSIVTTAVTNLDIHDISRSALTYGVSDFFVAHPVSAQRELVTRITSHWTDGAGARRIPDRKPAIEIVRVVESLEDSVAALGGDAEVWVTSARPSAQPMLDYAAARRRLMDVGPPVLLTFGTGWGLGGQIMADAAAQLAPIESDGYNHLSVRAAAAITFDRLLGAH